MPVLIVHHINFQMTAAEVQFAVMLAEHNAPLSMADHIGPMVKKNFSKSEVAQGYQSARTKTSCILNGAVAPDLKQKLVEAMKQQPYSLSTVHSEHRGRIATAPPLRRS